MQILRRSSRLVTPAALAALLKLSQRKVLYRDVANLMGQRVPIEGEAGFGHLFAAGYDMPPRMFTSDEIGAIALGFQWVASRSDKVVSNEARVLVVKIVAIIPDHLRPMILDASEVSQPTIEKSEEDVDRPKLRSAIRGRLKLLPRFRSGSGEKT